MPLQQFWSTVVEKKEVSKKLSARFRYRLFKINMSFEYVIDQIVIYCSKGRQICCLNS